MAPIEHPRHQYIHHSSEMNNYQGVQTTPDNNNDINQLALVSAILITFLVLAIPVLEML